MKTIFTWNERKIGVSAQISLVVLRRDFVLPSAVPLSTALVATQQGFSVNSRQGLCRRRQSPHRTSSLRSGSFAPATSVSNAYTASGEVYALSPRQALKVTKSLWSSKGCRFLGNCETLNALFLGFIPAMLQALPARTEPVRNFVPLNSQTLIALRSLAPLCLTKLTRHGRREVE